MVTIFKTKSKWGGHLDGAISDWNVSGNLDLTEVAGAANNAVDCIPATGKIEVCASNYGNNGWLGVAGVWIAKGKYITKAYSKMNDYYFDNVSPYNGADSAAWRRMVMCQEVGHDFGLGHQDVNFDNANLGTCMDYTSDPSSNQHPNTNDYDQLVTIYDHADSESGDSGGPPPWAGGPNRGKTPGVIDSEWGNAVGTDANGRPNEFELDLGKGNKLITHVLWAN